MPALENTTSLLIKGYGWLPDLRRAKAGRTVPTRLMGLRATALEGPAVRLAGLSFDVPEQDLEISLRRIPARPESGVVLHVPS